MYLYIRPLFPLTIDIHLVDIRFTSWSQSGSGWQDMEDSRLPLFLMVSYQSEEVTYYGGKINHFLPVLSRQAGGSDCDQHTQTETLYSCNDPLMIK